MNIFFSFLAGRSNGVEVEADGTKTPPNTPTETPSESRASPGTVTQSTEPQETGGGVTKHQEGASCPNPEINESEAPTQESTQSEEPSQAAHAEGESGGAVGKDPPTSENVD